MPETGLRPEADTAAVHHRSVDIDGVRMFYREAGPRDGPGVLLLHGFPTSSFLFRRLMPALADRLHVVAPDFPGFGFSDAPDHATFAYTFDALADKVERLVDLLGLSDFALYLFDYGAPVGFRLAERRPERVTALVLQNGNAYEEGLGEAWRPIRRYWDDPGASNREALRAIFTLEAIRSQYLEGEPDPTRVSPESWFLDHVRLSRPGNADLQLDLFYDYRTNVARYPRWQQYLRTHQPPALIDVGDQRCLLPRSCSVPAPTCATSRTRSCTCWRPGTSRSNRMEKEITALMHDFLDRKTGAERTRH